MPKFAELARKVGEDFVEQNPIHYYRDEGLKMYTVNKYIKINKMHCVAILSVTVFFKSAFCILNCVADTVLNFQLFKDLHFIRMDLM